MNVIAAICDWGLAVLAAIAVHGFVGVVFCLLPGGLGDAPVLPPELVVTGVELCLNAAPETGRAAAASAQGRDLAADGPLAADPPSAAVSVAGADFASSPEVKDLAVELPPAADAALMAAGAAWAVSASAEVLSAAEAELAHEESTDSSPAPAASSAEAERAGGDGEKERARVDVPAKLLGRFAIEDMYPKASRRRGEEGEVLLELKINALGLVEKVLVVSSSGSADLDTAAVEVAKKAKFRPAEAMGRAVKSALRLPVKFSLKQIFQNL